MSLDDVRSCPCAERGNGYKVNDPKQPHVMLNVCEARKEARNFSPPDDETQGKD